MLLCFALMGIAIIGVALTPPALDDRRGSARARHFLRMLAGICAGRRSGTSTAFLLEAAAESARILYGIVRAGVSNLAVLASGLVGFTLANTLSGAAIARFWPGANRFFWLARPSWPFGLMMRRSLPETFHAPEAGSANRAAASALTRSDPRLDDVRGGDIGTYIRTYMDDLRDTHVAHACKCRLAATIVVGLCGVTFDLPSGRTVRSQSAAKPGDVGRRASCCSRRCFRRFNVIRTIARRPHCWGRPPCCRLSLRFGLVRSLLATESLPAAIRSAASRGFTRFQLRRSGGSTQYSRSLAH